MIKEILISADASVSFMPEDIGTKSFWLISKARLIPLEESIYTAV